MSLESGMDLDKDIENLEQEAEDFKKELFANLDPTQKCRLHVILNVQTLWITLIIFVQILLKCMVTV